MDIQYLLFGLAALAFCLACYVMHMTRQLHEPKWIWRRFPFDFVSAEPVGAFLVIGIFSLSFLVLLEMIFDPAAVLVLFIALLMFVVASIVYQLEVHRAERKRETEKALNQLAQRLADRRKADLDRSLTRGLNAALFEEVNAMQKTESMIM